MEVVLILVLIVQINVILELVAMNLVQTIAIHAIGHVIVMTAKIIIIGEINAKINVKIAQMKNA